MKNRIREIREQRGMTQDELAQLLGISRVAVTRYEGGHRVLNRAKENSIAEALGVKPDELYEDLNKEDIKRDKYIVEAIMDKTREGLVVWELEDRETEEVYRGKLQGVDIEIVVGENDRAIVKFGDKVIDSQDTPKVVRLVGMMYWKYGSVRSRVYESFLGESGRDGEESSLQR